MRKKQQTDELTLGKLSIYLLEHASAIKCLENDFNMMTKVFNDLTVDIAKANQILARKLEVLESRCADLEKFLNKGATPTSDSKNFS